MVILFYIYFLTYIGLGIVQPISALVRILSAKRKDSEYIIGLKKYLMLVVLYFSLMISFESLSPVASKEEFILVYLFIVPWAFAIWYIRHIKKWKVKNSNIQAFDREQLQNASNEDQLPLESYPKRRVYLKHPITNLNNRYQHSHNTIIKQLPILIEAN